MMRVILGESEGTRDSVVGPFEVCTVPLPHPATH